MASVNEKSVTPINDTNTKNDENQKETIEKAPFSNYWRILSFGGRIEHIGLLIATVCAAGSGVPLPLMNIVFGTLAGDFTGYFLPNTDITERQFRHSVAHNALLVVYLFIGKFVLTYFSMFFYRVMGLRISAGLRLAYIDALFNQPVKKIDEVSAGAVSNTITSNSNTIQLSISDRLHNLFQALALLIAAYAIAFRYSWQLTLATSSGILFVVLVISITGPLGLKAQQNVDHADTKHATVTSETIGSIRTVFSLGGEERQIEKHSKWVDESHRQSMRLAPILGFQLTPVFFAIYACYSLAFWFGLKLYREGHIANVGTVIIVFFSVLIVTTIMGNLIQPLIHISKAVSASTSFFDIIDSEKVVQDGARAPEVSAQGDIELKDVTFAYPTRPGVHVLSNFSGTFKKGKTTALVGPSGSGKSTIVAILERWYELSHHVPLENDIAESSTTTEAHVEEKSAPSTGSVVIDGHNINHFDLKWWRSRIGLVQQEPFLFNDTIENNVAFGLIGTEWQHAEPEKRSQLVREACDEAFADEFIRHLPKGYSTIVGEAGIKLSGGQRQRLAIARSIIRKPDILILDEATSSIDVQGEQIVQEALDRLAKNRTTVMIAHRLSTIRKADHIIVLKNGTKIEEGTHEQLLANPDGLYSGLTKAQQLEEEETAEVPDGPAPAELQVSRTLSAAHDRRASGPTPDLEQAPDGSGYSGKGFLRTVGLLTYEQRGRWPYYMLIVLGTMGAGAAFALQSWLFAQLIQVFLYTGQRLINAANFWALMFFILALSVGVCYGVLCACSVIASTHAGTTNRKDYFKDTLKMPIRYFDQEDHSSSSVMTRLSGDPKQIQEVLGLNSAFPLISVFQIIACMILSLYYGWKLALVTVFAVMPVIIIGAFIRVRYEIQYETMDAEVFAGSSKFATEAIGAFRTVASLAMEDTIIEKYKVLLQEQIARTTRKAIYASVLYAFTDSVELLGMALAFWYGGQLLASREYESFQFFVVYAAIVQGAQAAGQYMSFIPNVARSTSAANRILELRAKVAGLKQPSAETKPSPGGLGAAVQFKNVDFKYPTQTVPLYTRLNLKIEAGQYVAFVGPSGCGKTSIISLLERFYDPDAGTIQLDDQDIATLDPKVYRRHLSLVAQEPRLFSGTIRQNLLLGVDEDTVTEEQITQACRDAEIHDFIISLPDGYGTDLGLSTQTTLSGGQKQRLCLARALLRKPKLLLLDEATSSLDSQSEHLVQGAIERLAGQRSMTVVAVAHRLATIQKADVIYVFGERDVDRRRGTKIVEMGTHKELLAKRGVYWNMCQVAMDNSAQLVKWSALRTYEIEVLPHMYLMPSADIAVHETGSNSISLSASSALETVPGESRTTPGAAAGVRPSTPSMNTSYIRKNISSVIPRLKKFIVINAKVEQ